MTLYQIASATSTAVVEARSSMGPVVFEAVGLEGEIEVTVVDGAVDLAEPVSASIRVPMRNLRSGNDLFDGELARRIESRIHPWTTLSLDAAEPQGPGSYRLSGSMEFHGVLRTVTGAIDIERADDERIVVVGERTFDIRDFHVPAPTMLMLKIFPEVRVALLAEALRSDPGVGTVGDV